MKTKRRGAGNVIVDRAGNPDYLHAEIFKDRPGASQTPVTAQHDQGAVLEIGLKIADGRLLNPLIFKIFKAAAADRTAGLADHATRIVLVHLLNPVVRQSEKPMPDEMGRDAETVRAHVQFFQGGPGAGEVA